LRKFSGGPWLSKTGICSRQDAKNAKSGSLISLRPSTHALSGALVARATAPRNARISVAARGAAGFFAGAFPDVDVVLSLVSRSQHRGVTHSIAQRSFSSFGYFAAASVRRMVHSRSHELYDLESHGLKVSNDQILIFRDLGES
jgi:hypothetical protein